MGSMSKHNGHSLGSPAVGVPAFGRTLGFDAADIIRRDRTMLHGHVQGAVADSLSFYRFKPSVTIGKHQIFAREVRESFCADIGIAVARRITAGGALYLDEGQQGFSLIVPKVRLGATVAARLETGAGLLSDALAMLGIAAEFKAPNDLQISGRQKIGSVFLAEEGGSALLYGSIIVDLDLKTAMQALLVPTEKLTVTGLEHAKERMTSLSEILGDSPSAEALEESIAGVFNSALGGAVQIIDAMDFPATLPTSETKADPDWELAGDRFETKDKVPGATMRLILGFNGDNSINHIRFSTDGHFSPDTALHDLASDLTGASAEELTDRAAAWFAAHQVDMAGFCADDVIRLVERAVSKKLLQDQLGFTAAQASGVMLAGKGHDVGATLENASVMLVPYCAKPNWCKWRHTIDCVECGKCEVGDAYIMARERNMEVVTITNFEHLAETLDKMKSAGVQSYVGMCCGEFFLKRHHAFRDSGMDAVLLDIEGATCYELKEEHLAYAGAFKAEAALDLDAVMKLMSQVPKRPISQRPCITGIARRPGEKRADDSTQGGCGSCACGTVAAET